MREVASGCIISSQLRLAQLYTAAIPQSLISLLSPTGGESELGQGLWTSSSLWSGTLADPGCRATGCSIYCSSLLQGLSWDLIPLPCSKSDNNEKVCDSQLKHCILLKLNKYLSALLNWGQGWITESWAVFPSPASSPSSLRLIMEFSGA